VGEKGLGISAKDTYLRDKFHRLKARMGTKKAVMAIVYKILVAIFHMLQCGIAFAGLGGDYLNAINKHGTAKRLIRHLDLLGYEVVLRPQAAA
jgi:transposase